MGAAACRRFEANGDRVVALDRTAPGAVVECDVADEDSVAAAFAEARRRHGPVGVLVCAAAVTGAGTVLDEEPATWRRILDVNLTGAYLCCREAIADMQVLGGGTIVLVASVVARAGGTPVSGPAYAASKGGLVTLARFLAQEHASDGIRTNTVAPGPHDTPMWTALDERRRKAILASIPGGTGPGDPDDLAATIVHLCSPEARFVNGATVDVNGGLWMG